MKSSLPVKHIADLKLHLLESDMWNSFTVQELIIKCAMHYPKHVLKDKYSRLILHNVYTLQLVDHCRIHSSQTKFWCLESGLCLIVCCCISVLMDKIFFGVN